jgi:hypothetical protein
MPRNWYECCHERSWNHLLSGRIWIQKRPFKYGEEDSLENNDAVLIRMAQNGDYRSIESLHDRYRPSIYSYFYYRVAEVATAEDLTSEVSPGCTPSPITCVWTISVRRTANP